MRADRCSTPILMLTARSDIEDRIQGLNAGADYYLTKSFDSRELLACVNALLRRQGDPGGRAADGKHRAGPCLLYAGMRRKQRPPVRREFDVMRFLLQGKGRVLSKEMILARSGATIPAPWKIMWRSTWAFCGKSSRASAPI